MISAITLYLITLTANSTQSWVFFKGSYIETPMSKGENMVLASDIEIL